MTRTTVTLVLLIAGSARAADPPFPPTAVTAPGSAPARERLLEFGRRAGVALDLSALPNDASIQKSIADMPFWSAVKTVADGAGCRVVVHGLGDRVAFAPGPSPPESLSGPFRFVAKSVTSKFDYDTGRAGTDVAVEMHWEPRIRVFRLSKSELTLPGVGAKAADAGKAGVTGSRHVVTARFPAIPRPADGLMTVRGTVTLAAAEKLLRVSFDDLSAKARTQTLERVGVTLHSFEKIDDVWEAKVALAYPQGMPAFESFEAEAWLRDNACRLVSPDRTKSFEAKDFQVRVTPNGATVVYRFPEDKVNGMLPGTGWRLEVDTPSPLVEFPLAFELKGIRRP